jgi:hypothetical protein
MSASVQVIEYWRGQDVLEEVEEAGDYALAYAAREAVMLDKPVTPVYMGWLRNSKTTHSPDYATNDLDAAQGGDLFVDDVEMIKRQVVDHAIAFGSWVPYAYPVHQGTSVMQARPTTLEAGDLVAANMDEYFRTGLVQSERVI